MATGGGGSTPRLYEEDDRLDERLLNQISKWILYHRLPSLARHLGISDAEISRIIIPSRTPEEQCFQIIKKWHERNLLSVRDLMKAMVEWHRERYIDPAVWEKLIRNKVNPAVMPALSVLQSLPPPSGAGHSALQRLPNPSRGARLPLEFHAEFQVREMLQGQIEHHEEEVVVRRAIVEEIVRLPGQHLQISHATPDQAPSPSNTTENITAPTVSSLPETSSNAEETVPPILSAPRFVPAGTSPSAPALVSDPTSSEAPASVPTPIFFSMVPARKSSKVPASVRALNKRSASVFFPPQTASNAPETVPGPTASNAPETVPGPTSSNAPETVPGPTASNAPETVPVPTASNAPETVPGPTASNAPETVRGPTASKVPETVPGPTASKVPKLVPIPTTSNIPKTLPAPTWSQKSEILPAKSSCQPETCPGVCSFCSFFAKKF